MLIKTHLLFAFTLGLIAIQYFNPANQILFMLLILLGAMLPDVDHPNSYLGRKIKVVSWFFKHRGFFHSLLILPVISFLLYYLLNTSRFTLPLLIGYTTHLAGDMLTKEGIQPFTPISSWTWRVGLFRVGSIAEYIIFGALLVTSGYLLIH